MEEIGQRRHGVIRHGVLTLRITKTRNVERSRERRHGLLERRWGIREIGHKLGTGNKKLRTSYDILDDFARDDEAGDGGNKGDAAGDLAAGGAFPGCAGRADAIDFATAAQVLARRNGFFLGVDHFQRGNVACA